MKTNNLHGEYWLRWDGGHEFIYQSSILDIPRYISEKYNIPVTGIFETDGASTPRFVWWIKNLSPFDWFDIALVHDYMFERKHMGIPIFTFRESNKFLRDELKERGVCFLKRWVIWLCVSTVGYLYWIGLERWLSTEPKTKLKRILGGLLRLIG